MSIILTSYFINATIKLEYFGVAKQNAVEFRAGLPTDAKLRFTVLRYS